jgi:hypothetical protein
MYKAWYLICKSIQLGVKLSGRAHAWPNPQHQKNKNKQTKTNKTEMSNCFVQEVSQV